MGTCRPSPDDLVTALIGVIGSRWPGHVLRVGIDGPDPAGKTTLADALAVRLPADRPVIRASIDGFHRPRAVPHRRGHLSPEGCYQDSFDHESVRRLLLGGPAAVRQRYRQRYLPGQRLYRDRCAPAERADIVVDNEDPARPGIVRWVPDGG